MERLKQALGDMINSMKKTMTYRRFLRNLTHVRMPWDWGLEREMISFQLHATQDNGHLRKLKRLAKLRQLEKMLKDHSNC